MMVRKPFVPKDAFMVSVTSGSELEFDMYETGLASALTPSVTALTNNRFELDFPGGLSDVLEGHGFAFDAAGNPTGGIITAITEYRDGALVFHADGVTLLAASLNDWLGNGDYAAIFGAVMAGGDTVTGSEYSDRIFGLDGNDVITGAAGDDFIEGGAGNDALYGGDDDDYLDGGDGDDRLTGGLGSNALFGGDGKDTAVYAGLVRNCQIEVGDDGLRVTGSGVSDALDSIESIAFKDGNLILDSDAAGAQIIRLYAAVLGRAPDTAGLDFYLGQIQARGGSLLGVANDLVSSTEFRDATGNLSNAQFVDYIYQHTLGREADAGGKAYYTQQLDGALGRGSFVVELSESAEHRALTADLVSRGYFVTDDTYKAVALLYDGFAGRLPDAGGLSYYAERVKAGAMTLAQVSSDFSSSAEFRSAIAGKDNGAIVDYIYQNTLHRAADVGGRAFYEAQLDHGATAASVLQDLALSAEHYALYAAHIAYGIDVL